MSYDHPTENLFTFSFHHSISLRMLCPAHATLSTVVVPWQSLYPIGIFIELCIFIIRLLIKLSDEILHSMHICLKNINGYNVWYREEWRGDNI